MCIKIENFMENKMFCFGNLADWDNYHSTVVENLIPHYTSLFVEQKQLKARKSPLGSLKFCAGVFPNERALSKMVENVFKNMLG